jgi:hypothetical protein
MSNNLPKNFEKILLGVAGVAALACATVGVLKYTSISKDFSQSTIGSGKDNAAIAEAKETDAVLNSLKSNRVFDREADGERKVDLFVGIPLFANKNNPNEPVDLLKGTPVHPPIPNRWWLDNNVDITYSDSPSRDDDGDGYSNLEEFEAKTNPKDAQSFPSLIKKLVYHKDYSAKWYVKFGLESEGRWSPAFLGASADGKALKNRVAATEMLNVGDIFFKEGDFAGRFKFTGFTEKDVVSARTGLSQKVKVAQFEDLKSNKKGTKYESQSGLPEAEIDANAYYDRTAILELKASGQEGKEFKVEEGTKFALPPGAPEKTYLLKSVTPEAITVEYTKTDGTSEVVEIKK